MEERDTALTELGQQLSDAKLEVDTLKEESSFTVIDKNRTGQWLEDADVHFCQICDKEFNRKTRKVSVVMLNYRFNINIILRIT